MLLSVHILIHLKNGSNYVCCCQVMMMEEDYLALNAASF